MSVLRGKAAVMAGAVVIVLLLSAGVSQGNGWKPMSLGTSSFAGIWGTSSSDVFAVGANGTILHYDGAAWTPMVSGTPVSLAGVWGTSASDVFAVGGNGTILHYDGAAWTSMETGTDVSLRGIWGSSSSDVFAVGSAGTILHYDGSAWLPTASGSKHNLSEIWGSSSNDVFAIGSLADNNYPFTYRGTILHFDGSTWTAMAYGPTVYLSGIWGTSSSDVFVVGNNGAILHYDGSAWTPMTSGTTTALYGIWGASSTYVFAVGSNGTILHYNGLAWKTMASGTTSALSQVWGSSTHDVFAAGGDGEIRYYNGTAWSGTLLFPNLLGIWGASSSNIFAVGSRGSILNYDGAAWTPMTSGATENLHGVWGASASRVFAVGAAGTILRYNGTAWSRMASGTTVDLNGIWGVSSTDVFAVGDGGTILHYDGAAWTPMSSGTTKNLNAIWGDAATRIVFAVGDEACIQRYTPLMNWYTYLRSDCIDWAFHGVWGTSSSDVYFVGDEGVVRHFNGASLSVMEAGTETQLWGIWGTSSSDIFVVESCGVRHFNGSSWTPSYLSGLTGWLRGIWGNSGGAAFAVGGARMILRKSGTSDAPTTILLSAASVAESQPAGKLVGWLSTWDPDAGDTFTYTLVDGAGSADNGSFRLEASQLRTGAVFDSRVKSSYAIRVRSTDQGGRYTEKGFTIGVFWVNHAPVFLKGPDQAVLEDAGPQTVGAWATGVSAGREDESGQKVTFFASSNNTSLFSAQPAIAPDGTLRYTTAANANGSATVTVRLSDDGGMANGGVNQSPEQTFAITVAAVNDPPSFTAGRDQTVLEDAGVPAEQTVVWWAWFAKAGPPNESGQTTQFVVTNDNNALFAVQPAIAANGTLRYTPAAFTSGSAQVTVQLLDNGGTADGGVDASVPHTFTITVTPYLREPSAFTLSGRQLLLDGNPFTIRGVVYTPVPVGADPETAAPYGDYFTSAYGGIQDRDLPLLRQLGANAVLIPYWENTADHRLFLDKAYNGCVNPLYVIPGFWINPGLDIDPASPANVREQLKTDFSDMVRIHRSHPAILFWLLGGDLNVPGMYGGDLGNLFSLIDELAGLAHEAEGDAAHPVAAGLADTDLIATIAASDGAVPNLDLWGAAVYRGATFGSLFTDYETASDKPLVILGYGSDAYDGTRGDEHENIGAPRQGDAAVALWEEIEANAAICPGGTIAAYSDEWWRGRLSADEGCLDVDPALQSACGQADAAEPDGYLNEEFRGIARVADNGSGPDRVQPREAYYALQRLWAPAGLSPGISESPQTPLSFGRVNIGQVSPGQTVTFTNSGNTNLDIGAIVVAGADPADFGIRNNSCSGRTLVPASSCTVAVVFAPTVLNARSATLSVPSSDPVRGTVSMALQGQGVDTLPPSGTVTINGGAAATRRTAVALTLTASDLGGGPIRMCISNSPRCSSWAPFKSTKSWRLPSGNGTRTVRVWFRDRWGHTSKPPQSDTIVLDTRRPANGTVTVAPGNTQLTLRWSGFSDSPGTGITGFRAVFKAGSAPLSCTSGTPVPGYGGTEPALVHPGLVNGQTYGYRVCAIDAVGNMSSGATVTGRPTP